MESNPTIPIDNQYVLSRIEENKFSKNLKIIKELKQIAPLLHLFTFQTPIFR